MALRGYVPKGKKAIWQQAFPSQVAATVAPVAKRIRSVSKSKASEHRLYVAEARAFVAAAVARGETCRVVEEIAMLRDGHRYGHPISAKLSEVHHTRGRLAGLLREQRFWIPVSKQGHRFIHSNIEYSRKRGWICAAGDWNKQP